MTVAEAPTTNDLLTRLVTRLMGANVARVIESQWTMDDHKALRWRCVLCDGEAWVERNVRSASLTHPPRNINHADDCPSILARRLVERLGL